MGKISRAESDMDGGLSLDGSETRDDTTNRSKTVFFCAEMDEPCIMNRNAVIEALGADTRTTYDNTG